MTSDSTINAQVRKARKIYPIVKYGNPVLEAPTQPVTKFDAELEELCQDMFESMYAAQGVGLAATQIGRNLRLAVVDVTTGKTPEARIVLANPQIIHTEGEVREEEGCLSVADFSAEVRRHARVSVRGLDREGKPVTITGEGLLAVVLQHEVDHLDGILFIDRISRLKRSIYLRRLKKQAAAK